MTSPVTYCKLQHTLTGVSSVCRANKSEIGARVSRAKRGSGLLSWWWARREQGQASGALQDSDGRGSLIAQGKLTLWIALVLVSIRSLPQSCTVFQPACCAESGPANGGRTRACGYETQRLLSAMFLHLYQLAWDDGIYWMACTLASTTSALGSSWPRPRGETRDRPLFHSASPFVFSTPLSSFNICYSILGLSEVIVHSFHDRSAPRSLHHPERGTDCVRRNLTLLSLQQPRCYASHSIPHSFVHETQLTSNDNS